MAAILLDIGPGDEIIMPSFTFVSTANSFVLRGGVPVFVDIRADTLNLDDMKIEAAITSRTKAIVPVHYAGVACDMENIICIAERHRLRVVEDAAQAFMSTYNGRGVGTLGELGTVSFHETKNVTSGEGGALLINHSDWIEMAETIWEKGTNRARFIRGELDKYTWVNVGSSFLPSEIGAAFLLAQLEEAETIMASRLRSWNQYHEGFAALEAAGKVRRPMIPAHCTHNAHTYYLLLPDSKTRDLLIERLSAVGIQAVSHYVPLHDSPAGKRYGRTEGDLSVTQSAGSCLIRLPLWAGMADEQTRTVIEETIDIIEKF